MTVSRARRTALALLCALPFAHAPALAETAPVRATLVRDGQRQALYVDPATLGYRTSWDGGDGVYTFNIDAEGPGGTYSLFGTAVQGQPGEVILFVPGLPGLGAAPDTVLGIDRVAVDGYHLQVRGWAQSAEAGLRIEFDATLPHLEFAPTQGPTD